jgi:hypothetical protein
MILSLAFQKKDAELNSNSDFVCNHCKFALPDGDEENRYIMRSKHKCSFSVSSFCTFFKTE